MPKYDRQCECGNTYEVTCKISEKDNHHPCPVCSSGVGSWLVSAPSLVQAQRLSTAKKDTGFKEVLAKIAERNPRTSINQQV